MALTTHAWDVPDLPEADEAAAAAPHEPLLAASERTESTFAQDLRQSLTALWDSRRYSDVRLQARSGEEVLAHRLVISARSSHLAALLAEAPTGSSPTRLVVDAEREALVGVLCFLYTDELPTDAPAEQLLRLRLQAQEWQLAVLDERCACALAEKLTVRSVCAILRACAREEAHARLALGAPRDATRRLKQACGAFAAAHFDRVHREEAFALLAVPLQVWLFAQRTSHPLHCSWLQDAACPV